MNGIVQCQCGANVRVPPGGVAFRCPRCQTVLSDGGYGGGYAAAPPVAQAAYGYAPPPPQWAPAPPPPPPPPAPPAPRIPYVEPEPATSAQVGAMCPICQTAVTEGDGVVNCPSCRQVHHHECWMEVGGCATYGCDQSPAVQKADPAAAGQQLTGWGDTKTCPVCRQLIRSVAVKCRFCGTDFGTMDPLTVSDLRQKQQVQMAVKSVRGVAVTIFVLSVILVLAPLMSIVCLAWVLPQRKMLARAGPVYVILGYSSLGLSLLFTLLMVLMYVLS